jgi:hypothetical protein
MFPLNRPSRQGLATLALFLLTVVPTIWIAATAWRINRPGHIRDVEIELGRQLGLQVTLRDVRYPRPGDVVYRGIVLRQEEARSGGLAEIARADEVRLQRVDRELTIQLENPRVRGESPGLALAQVGALMQRSGLIPFERINVTSASCQLDLGRDDLRFSPREIAGEFLVDPAMPTVRLAYRMPGAATGTISRDVGGRGQVAIGTHCELTLTRDRRTEPLVTSIVIKTVEGLPLPARVLNAFFNAEDWLGANATVEGTLSLRQSGTKDWEAEFEGSLHEIELGKVVGRRFPLHRLAGRARVTIPRARWGQRPDQRPGWVEVKGELLAGPGSVGVDLLHALAREMKFRLSPRLSNLDPRKIEIEFRALGLAFDMQPNGEIHLSGALGSESPPEAVLDGATYPLVSAPRGAASVHGLIKTLFPVADANPGVLVPLTPESSVLLALPVPPTPLAKTRRTVDGN